MKVLEGPSRTNVFDGLMDMTRKLPGDLVVLPAGERPGDVYVSKMGDILKTTRAGRCHRPGGRRDGRGGEGVVETLGADAPDAIATAHVFWQNLRVFLMPGGRPPTPTSLHKLRGTFRADRHGSRLSSAGSGRPIRPRSLNGEARKHWEAVVPSLVKASVVEKLETPALTALCELGQV